MDAQKDWVDYRLFKQAVSMQAVLDRYGINWLRRNKDELRGRCPIHKGEEDRSFHVNIAKSAFQCFSCGAKGNVLELVALIERCSIREAALKLLDWHEGDVSSSRGKDNEMNAMSASSTQREVEKVPEIINPPLSFELHVDHNHDYAASWGVDADTVRYFGAGLCLSKGTFAGRYVIPLHNAAGELVGYAGRSLDDSEPKYLFPSRDKGFSKSHLLFNLHRVLNKEWHRRDPVRGRIITPVIVVQGFFSSMKLCALNYSSVGLLGSSLSEQQERLLSSYFNHVVLLFDGDNAGRAGINECLLRLGRQTWVTAVDMKSGWQADQLTDEELKDLLYS